VVLLVAGLSAQGVIRPRLLGLPLVPDRLEIGKPDLSAPV
jgi:hypothetical protein